MSKSKPIKSVSVIYLHFYQSNTRTAFNTLGALGSLLKTVIIPSSYTVFSLADLKLLHKGTKSLYSPQLQQVKIMSIDKCPHFVCWCTGHRCYDYLGDSSVQKYTYSSIVHSLEFVFLETRRNDEKRLRVSGLSSVTHDAFILLEACESQLTFS